MDSSSRPLEIALRPYRQSQDAHQWIDLEYLLSRLVSAFVFAVAVRGGRSREVVASIDAFSVDVVNFLPQTKAIVVQPDQLDVTPGSGDCILKLHGKAAD